jgi:hypothetical protein
MRPLTPLLAALAGLAALLAPAAAGAAQPAPSARLVASAAPVSPAPARLPRLGLVLDAGLPSGAGLLVQARLFDAVRLQAGPMWSGVGWGAKGGLVLAPFRWAVSPTLEAEAGYGVRADLSFLADRGNVPKEMKPVLAHARYWFAAGYLGLDLGSPRRFSFFLRGGLARLQITAPGTARTTSTGGTLELGDATLTATVPCAKVGLQLWF